jgi:PAS domain-containing protein
MKDALTQNLDPAAEPWATIFDASHNGIAVIDRDGFVLVYNHAAQRIFNETVAALWGCISQRFVRKPGRIFRRF